jgi:hypothetical protein
MEITGTNCYLEAGDAECVLAGEDLVGRRERVQANGTLEKVDPARGTQRRQKRLRRGRSEGHHEGGAGSQTKSLERERGTFPYCLPIPFPRFPWTQTPTAKWHSLRSVCLRTQTGLQMLSSVHRAWKGRNTEGTPRPTHSLPHPCPLSLVSYLKSVKSQLTQLK